MLNIGSVCCRERHYDGRSAAQCAVANQGAVVGRRPTNERPEDVEHGVGWNFEHHSDID